MHQTGLKESLYFAFCGVCCALLQCTVSKSQIVSLGVYYKRASTGDIRVARLDGR